MADSAGEPLLLRADASGRIGTGHVMRCLALAQAWQDRGGRALFATAGLPSPLCDRLLAEGCGVETIAAEPGTSADASETATLAGRIGAEWVALDGYHFDGAFQQAVKEAGPRVLAIDDFGHAGHYPADLVLNQNLGADELLYAERGSTTRLLLGPRYAMLRREFAAYRGYRREVPEVGRKVLVTLGGADPDNVTLVVIEALGQVAVDGLEAVVVVGGSNPHRPALEEAVRRSSARIELRIDVRNMPELMACADVAVAAGGTTSWERALLGLPSVIVVLADNQEAIAAELQAYGMVRNLGWYHKLGVDELAHVLSQLAEDPAGRTDMAVRSQRAVDGRGSFRVVQQMSGEQELRLRSATLDDARLLWEWVNDPAVRQLAFSTEPIPWDGHIGWFARRLSDPDCRIYLAEDASGRPVGQVRFDRTAAGETDIDVSVAAEHRGGGIGAVVIQSGVARVFADGWAIRVNAYIKPDNAASLRTFRKAGFTFVGDTLIRDHPAIYTVLEASRD